MTTQLHGILFAYRDNPHLRELTSHRTVASIPFGGRYRMIDFMLSNMVNAGIVDIGVVMQEKCQSLLDHLGSGGSAVCCGDGGAAFIARGKVKRKKTAHPIWVRSLFINK